MPFTDHLMVVFFQSAFRMLFQVASLPLYIQISLAARQTPLLSSISSPFTTKFNEIATSDLHRWHTPGLAIAVIDGDETFSKVSALMGFMFIFRGHETVDF